MSPFPAFFVFLLLGMGACGSQSESAQDAPKTVNPAKEVVCFVYHRFGDDRYPSTNVSLADFEQHLNYLHQHGYQVLTFEKALTYLKSPDTAQKTAVITIDDGYRSFYEHGLPLLEKYGFPATLFINTQTVGSSDYMGWDALMDAQKRNVEIGNHSHSHAYFLNLAEDVRYSTFEEELRLSQQLIREHLGTTPKTFAYPYGELDQEMKSIVTKTGFSGAAAQNSGVIHSGTDLMRCPRFPMSESYADLKKFISKANMHALVPEKEDPSSFLIPSGSANPILTLEVRNEELETGHLNCFIQGSECQMSTEDLGNGKTKITIQAATSITGRRRTLYTITGQDRNGGWHWYSHLWINPEVE